MSRSKIIEELTNLLAIALRHKIGSVVNENEIYSQKYAKDAEVLIEQAKKNMGGINFSIYEIKEIINKTNIKLKKELESKPFLKDRKFEIMNVEMNKVLNELGLTNKE